jgi:hypothetical protein
MTKVWALVGVLYWLALAALPFLPMYLALWMMSRTHCEISTQCFADAIPVASEMGVALAILAIFLWPFCLWNLGGRWLWRRLRER